MVTSKQKTFEAMNGGFLNTSDMTINEGYLNDSLQLLIANDRQLYEAVHANKRHKPTAIVWWALMKLAEERLEEDFYPKHYEPSSQHLKDWLSEYGHGYDTLKDSVDYIIEERKSA